MKRRIASLMTSGNLLCGLFSILSAIDGHPKVAAWLVILAAVLDAFDGKAARFFGGESEFGLEYDSLADMVSFGIAPAILIYTAAFQDLGIPGLVVTAIPVVFAAIRLARFNVSADGKAHDFTGLSSPLHACLITSFVVLSYSRSGEIANSNVLAAVVLTTSVLMVIPIPLAGLPRFTLRQPGYNLFKVLLLLGSLVYMALNPARNTFLALCTVVLAGFIAGTVKMLAGRRAGDDDDFDDEIVDEEIGEETATAYRGRR